jgi:hypothetical protein
MACEIMLQRGNTLPNMLSARFETAADAIIARHYTARLIFPTLAVALVLLARSPLLLDSIFAKLNPKSGHRAGNQLQINSSQRLSYQYLSYSTKSAADLQTF